MTRIICLIGLVFCAMPSLVSAQPLQPNEWRTYTSMRSITALAVSSDSIYAWAGTTGGVFRVNLRDTSQPLLALHTTEGLFENNIMAIATDLSGNTYFGGKSGGFDVYTSDGKVRSLGADIQKANFPLKAINDIYVSGKKIYLSTSFGIVEYITEPVGAFGSTVSKIGPLEPNDSVRQVLVADGYLFAAMHDGVAIIPANADLRNPAKWSVVRDTTGAVRSLASFNGRVFIGTDSASYFLSNDRSSLEAIAGLDKIRVNRSVVRDSLYVLDIAGTVHISGGGQTFRTEDLSAERGSSVVAIAIAPYEGIVSGSSKNGLDWTNSLTHSGQFPAGPVNNEVTNLHFASKTDQLYVSHLDVGLSMFTPSANTWANYEAGVGGTLAARYERVFYDSVRDYVWISGRGALLRAKGLGTDHPTWQKIDTNNDIPSFDGGTFKVTFGMMLDRNGNLVVASFANTGRGLLLSSDDDHFNSYALASPPINGKGLPWGSLTQDLEGNYWVGTIDFTDPAPQGLFWHRWRDHTFGLIPAPPLANPRVTALLTDQDDGIWCGTQGGLQILSNPWAINDADPRFSIRTVPLLSSQVITSMTTDGVGNKWIGTFNGIFVVSADGSDSIAHFTKENSLLIDNTVSSIAIDAKRGEAYAGTPSGISRFSTIFKQGAPNYGNMRVYPNPVVQTTEFSPTIYIDGLVAGSTVQIFSIAGRLIRTINGTALGSIVVWDGRDAVGRQVPSGLYLVSATSAQSGENGAAKVVIVRKQ